MNSKQKKNLALVVIGFFIGVLWFAALRVVLIQDKTVHYHANFALYINGQKDPLDDFTQYEEVQACSGESKENPKGRAHLHKPNTHVVHVHDDAVTWNTFYANIGYGLTDQSITVDGKVYVDGQDGKELTFILNGKKVDTAANRVIENTDALLVNYGSESDDEIMSHYNDIPKDAAEVNKQYNPASCSGTEPLTFTDRIEQAFDFTR